MINLRKGKDYRMGEIFGFVTLTGKYEYRKNHIIYVEAVCSCGKIKFYAFSNLKSGHTKSCGCYNIECAIKRNTVHGFKSEGKTHPIYASYMSMKARCYNKNEQSYHNYGGNGVIVCDEWLKDFMAFYNWSIKNGWRKGLEIDKDIKGDGKLYSPETCVWVTSLQNNRNRRNNFIITAFGETKCLSAWVTDNRCNIGSNGLRKRILKGWRPEDAIITKNIRYAIAG